MTEHLTLGASLYVPATRPDLVAIGNGVRYPNLRSVIFCTEDAIRPDEVELGLGNLESAFARLLPGRLRRFVRVRTPAVMRRLLTMPGIEAIDGFVLPKVTRRNLLDYLDLLDPRSRFTAMPILETAEAFDAEEMKALRRLLDGHRLRDRILALRIGGNDLLNTVGVRRSPRRTIYDTPVGWVIAMLAGLFKPCGFSLTAPVFEGLNHAEVLRAEVERDLDHGLFGKSAVHPDQIDIIEAGYRVTPEDLDTADRVLGGAAPAVFRLYDTMCEGATHTAWAHQVRTRAATFGIIGGEGPRSMPANRDAAVPAGRTAVAPAE